MEKVNVNSIKQKKDTQLSILVKEFYNLIKDYIIYKGGFIDTQNKEGNKNDIFADTIELGGIDGSGEERVTKYIYGVKVVNNEIFIADEYVNLEEEKPIWNKEDFEKESVWRSLAHSKHFVVLPTLLCLADSIEEY